MNEKNIEQRIKDGVLDKIRNGNVHIRPKVYFAARLVSTILVAFLTLGISVFVISYIFFSIHESGELFLLGFGKNGVLTFILLFPWISLLINIILLFLLERLIQGFRFGHRISLLYIFLYIFICSTVIGILVNFTTIHKKLLNLADNGDLPIIGEMYESIHDSHTNQGVFKGVITSIKGSEITIVRNDKDHDGDEGQRVVMLPPNSPILNLGDTVYIFGSSTGSNIGVIGIQKVSSEE